MASAFWIAGDLPCCRSSIDAGSQSYVDRFFEERWGAWGICGAVDPRFGEGTGRGLG